MSSSNLQILSQMEQLYFLYEYAIDSPAISLYSTLVLADGRKRVIVVDSAVHKSLVILVIAVFGLSSISVCMHHLTEKHAHFDKTSQVGHAENELLPASCPNDDRHEDHADSHFCLCPCHVPVLLEHTNKNSLHYDAEGVLTNPLTILANGFSSRLERPPRIS